MKRILLISLALLIAASFAMAEEAPVLKVSGSTGGTVYHDDQSAGVLDADQDVTLAFGPLSLALNAGYTYTFAATVSHVISYGYSLAFSQAFGPLTLAASVASDALAKTIGGDFAGNWIGPINASAAIAKAPFGAALVGVFSGVKGGPFFRGIDLSGTYTPKWGAFTLGAAFTDAAADAIGAMVADVEGLSFYAKAKVSY